MILKFKNFCRYLLKDRDSLKRKIKLKIFKDILKKRYFTLSFKDNFNNKYKILADWYDLSNLDITISLLKNDEYKITYIKKYLLRNNCIIIDAGAHIGIFTLYCKKIFRNSKIIALEPINKNLKFLKVNIKLNGCRDITVLPYALYKDEIIKINITERSWGHTIFGNPHEKIVKVEEVKAISWLTLVKYLNLNSVDLLKMDIEGAEYEVLRQIQKSAVKPIMIAIEYHLWAGYSLKELIELVRKCGYKILYHKRFGEQGILILKL